MMRWLSAALAACAGVCLLSPVPQANTNLAAAPSVPRQGAVGVYVLGPTSLVAGSSASYRVTAHWATGPRTSGPLPGGAVSLLLRGGGREIPLSRATTDASGNAHFRFPVPRVPAGTYELLLKVAASLGEDTRKIEVQVHPGGQILLTTDKKLYQPSQLIHIRALALRSMDLRPVADRPVRIQVTDPKGTVVYLKEGRTSRFGVAALDFQLADEINLGPYSIEARVEGAEENGRASKTVEVKRYVLPKFRVSLETERRYYRPGEVVRGTLRSAYFFGKPVTGAQVTLDSYTSLVGHYSTPTARSFCTTDGEGRCPFELSLPSAAARTAKGEVRIVASVVDTARHREQGDLSLPLTASPLQLSLVPENRALVRGTENRVHVVAGYPDGTTAAKVKVTLRAGERNLEGLTDALGVATFTLLPQRSCSASNAEHGMALEVSAADPLGQRASLAACAPLAPARAVLVRPATSLVVAGREVTLDLFTAPAKSVAEGQVFLDVVKAGQTLATFTPTLRRGRARVRFAADGALFGLLELRGYRLSPEGERESTSRMVYVDHPGELRITAAADREVYRPGGRARLTFQVVDSRTGDGVEAALGLLAIDDAVVALGGLEQSSPKVFFTLASQVRGEGAPRVRPGGRDLEQWVASTDTTVRRTRAADVLLAAVQPAPTRVFETNPWRERREAWTAQAPRLISAALQFMREHSVGVRTAKGWRFDPELVPRMLREGRIESSATRDPWKRVVRPWSLRETDASFVFDRHARRLAPQKLEHIYEVLARVWKDLKLGRERMRRLPRRKWPLVVPHDLLERLVRLGTLKPHEIVDPWGRPYRVLLNPRLFVNPYYLGLVSRYLIHSAGPDGISGTQDDVGPDGPRALVSVFGRDSALGSDADDAIGGLVGTAVGEAYGVGGLGLIGHGSGGGGAGYGVAYGRAGTIGHGAGLPTRVRSAFPETLLWHPELITDRSGHATLEVPLADSITDWKLVATGSTTEGLLGTSAMTLRVFQDFFVDLDLPATLTQGDRISVPVSVYNYLKTPQRVVLRLKPESWFTPAGSLEQTIDLAPAEVGVRYFPIVARRVGRQDLTVNASALRGKSPIADAVRRSTQVEPDGVEHALSFGGPMGRPVDHELTIPENAIEGTARVEVATYAGPVTQTLRGMEGLLRKPYGCFEQTSSATYPNVLLLDYLRRTRASNPEVERRAKELINEGYQRLIGFEVGGGGFSWFGNAPANKVLTAYGLMEFHDMARVHPVDPRLIERTQRWLASKARSDGSFGPDSHNLHDGATNHFDTDVLRITAYVAHALRHTGHRGPALTKALGYVRRHQGQAKDAYTLAIIGNLLAQDRDDAARRVMDRLWHQRRSSDKGLYFEGPSSTLTHGAGESGRMESTAMAALAFLGADRTPLGLERVMDTLVSSRDSFGAWQSTQATILTLRALLAQHERQRSRPSGEVQVLVDGREQKRLRITPDGADSHRLDLSPHAARGRHRVALRFVGTGNLQYHLVGRFWLPRGTTQKAESEGTLAIDTTFDRIRVKAGEPVKLAVEVRNRSTRAADMPLVALALPPGFIVDDMPLTALVQGRQVDKVQRVGGQALLYLSKLGGGQTLRFTLPLRSRYPLRVQARPSVVYEYYRPENRAESAPQILSVL